MVHYIPPTVDGITQNKILFPPLGLGHFLFSLFVSEGAHPPIEQKGPLSGLERVTSAKQNRALPLGHVGVI
jgi:hypothetical protein